MRNFLSGAAKRRQRRCPRQEANAAQCGFLELEEHPVLFWVLRKWTEGRVTEYRADV